MDVAPGDTGGLALLGMDLKGFEGFPSLSDFRILSFSPFFGAGAVQVLGFPLQGSLQAWSQIDPGKAPVTG